VKCLNKLLVYSGPSEVVREFKAWLFRVSRLRSQLRTLLGQCSFIWISLASPAHYNWMALRAFGWALQTLCLMLALPNAHLPWEGPRFTGSIYLEVDNVDELWKSLKTRARIVYSR
jgi:hypothetical protein